MDSPHKRRQPVFSSRNARIYSHESASFLFAVSDPPLAGGEPRLAAAALAATGDVALLLPRIEDAAFCVFAVGAGDSAHASLFPIPVRRFNL